MDTQPKGKKVKKKKRKRGEPTDERRDERREPVERAIAHRSKAIGKLALKKRDQGSEEKQQKVRAKLSRDADVPSSPEKWDGGHCKKVIQNLGSDWKEIHAELKSDTTALRRLVAYRKEVVDGMIGEMRVKYPGLVASSVGSSDLTSDYDVTLGVRGGNPGDDVQLVRELNDRFKATFGKQPGSLFDTNFYINNFLPLRENIAPGPSPAEIPADDDGDTGPAGAAQQDVLSLLKQRRFMDQAEWDHHFRAVTGKVAEPTQHDETLRRYENADAVYKIGVHELLERTGDPKAPVSLSAEEEAMVSAQPAALREQARQELLLSRKLHVLDKSDADRVMEMSNVLYEEHMQRVRDLQGELRAVSDQTSSAAAHLRQDIETETGISLFFASEAYHTKGTILHVVAGLQGKDQTTLDALTPAQVLNSANEQAGDFLKDIRHYAEEGADDSVAFYRSAKYLSRLFDAIGLIKQKGGLGELDFERQYGTTIASLKEGTDAVLLSVRKGLTGLTLEENMDLSRDAVWNMFKVLTADELKQTVLSLVEEVNVKARSQPAPAAVA